MIAVAGRPAAQFLESAAHGTDGDVEQCQRIDRDLVADLPRGREAGRPGRSVEGLHDHPRGRDWRLESVVTMVGGRVVYAAGPYVRFNQPAPIAPR